jgi:diguanylate cyclase (GGDEF)-like protein/PAS domain S-box-containing protein
VYPRRLVLRHGLLSLSFLVLSLLLNRPEVIVLARLGLTAWYPATGLVLALLLGVTPWYGFLVLFADALAGKLIYHQPLLSFGETFGAAGLAICYALAAHLLRGRLHIDLGLRRRRDVVRYVFVTLAAAVVATAMGVTCLALDHTIPWNQYWSAATVWFLGDGIGLLGVAPFLLVHVFPWVRHCLASGPAESPGTIHPASQPSPHSRGRSEAFAQALAILVVLWAIFWPKSFVYEDFYLTFIPILWIAMRQGIRRAVAALLVFNFGIVVAMHFSAPTSVLLTQIGLLMLVVSASGLMVGSELSERERISLDLYARTSYLNSLIENSPLGIVVLDLRGRVELANAAFEKLLLSGHGDLASSDISRILSPDGSLEIIPRVISGETLHTTLRLARKDGKVLDLALYAVPLTLNGLVHGAYAICQDISEQVGAVEAERKHVESMDRVVQQLRLRAQQMTMLNEMGDLLECCANSDEAGQVVAHSVQKLFPEALSGTLYLLKSSQNLLGGAVSWGGAGVSEQTFLPELCWAIRRGQPHWSEPSGVGIVCSHLSPHSSVRSLCVPMVAQGSTLGMLHVEFGRNPPPGQESAAGSPTDTTQPLAVRAAGQIALSLASLNLRETLREQSIRDPLTGLFNRRFMEESLDREMLRAERRKQPVSILFLDLDHFKQFNDAFGHDAGDQVLRAIADLFIRFFRADDICCRHGGEEFAIILPEASSEDAISRADALREAVRNLNLQYKNQKLSTVTFSIGVATCPQHGSTAKELLKTADQCLYQSKARGRDVVTAPHS